MSKVMTVLGARPQFIKAAAVSRAMAAEPLATEIIVHTGQHHDAGMSDVFFDELGIPAPQYNLGIAGGGHGEMTGRMMIELERVMKIEQPDWLMVYGDTNSTLAAALVAAKLHVPVAHVEAGLRSFNRRMPEEVTRVLTDHCSEVLFTPTAVATANLRREGVSPDRIVETGDVMFDAVRLFGDREAASASVEGLESGNYVLATIHRQENTDDIERLAAILNALVQVSARIPVVLPLHPRTRLRIAEAGLQQALGTIRAVEPLGYLEMVGLQRGAAVIATDSGGVQKEAFFHGVPCVTLRDETEWTELVATGWNRLVAPHSAEAIVAAILSARGTRGENVELYGRGDASLRIVSRLTQAVAAKG